MSPSGRQTVELAAICAGTGTEVDAGQRRIGRWGGYAHGNRWSLRRPVKKGSFSYDNLHCNQEGKRLKGDRSTGLCSSISPAQI